MKSSYCFSLLIFKPDFYITRIFFIVDKALLIELLSNKWEKLQNSKLLLSNLNGRYMPSKSRFIQRNNFFSLWEKSSTSGVKTCNYLSHISVIWNINRTTPRKKTPLSQRMGINADQLRWQSVEPVAIYNIFHFFPCIHFIRFCRMEK